MTEDKTGQNAVFQKGFKAGVNSAKKRSPRPRLHKAQQSASSSVQYSRQIQYDDYFSELYNVKMVLKPSYLPDKMYELYEECGVLSACIDAMVDNIHGFGWDIMPVSGSEIDNMDYESRDEHPEKSALTDWFQTPNGLESFTSLSKECAKDYWVTGNAYFEVIRNLAGQPQLIFRADSRRMRLCALDEEETETKLFVKRGGEWVPVQFRKRFRKYAMLLAPAKAANSVAAVGGTRIRYFKEFGDPRIIDATTGKLKEELDASELEHFMPATEIIHYKNGSDAYGIPPWIGELLEVMGLPKAQYINYDLFDSQGIPPLIVSIAGGQLTEESMEDLVGLFQKAKGVDNFHKLLVLETESTGYGLQDKEATPRLTVQSMAGYRKDDILFQKYMSDAREAIRIFGFRLPSMFLGAHTDFNYATGHIIREIAEEQLFIPNRNKFDELINLHIVRNLGITNWQFKTRAPFIRSNDEIIKLIPSLLDNGAFTVNELIEFVNKTFGTSMKLYTGDDAKEWSNVPTPLVFGALHNFGTTTATTGAPSNGETQGGSTASNGSDNGGAGA